MAPRRYVLKEAGQSLITTHAWTLTSTLKRFTEQPHQAHIWKVRNEFALDGLKDWDLKEPDEDDNASERRIAHRTGLSSE